MFNPRNPETLSRWPQVDDKEKNLFLPILQFWLKDILFSPMKENIFSKWTTEDVNSMHFCISAFLYFSFSDKTVLSEKLFSIVTFSSNEKKKMRMRGNNIRKWCKCVIDIFPGLHWHENRAAPWRKIFLTWPWFVDTLNRLKGATWVQPA